MPLSLPIQGIAISSFGETMAMASLRIGGGAGSAACAAGALAGSAAAGAAPGAAGRLSGGAAGWQPSSQTAPRIPASASRHHAAIGPPPRLLPGRLVQRSDEAALLDLAQQAEVDEVGRLEALRGRLGLALEHGLDRLLARRGQRLVLVASGLPDEGDLALGQVHQVLL